MFPRFEMFYVPNLAFRDSIFFRYSLMHSFIDSNFPNLMRFQFSAWQRFTPQIIIGSIKFLIFTVTKTGIYPKMVRIYTQLVMANYWCVTNVFSFWDFPVCKGPHGPMRSLRSPVDCNASITATAKREGPVYALFWQWLQKNCLKEFKSFVPLGAPQSFKRMSIFPPSTIVFFTPSSSFYFTRAVFY